MKISMAIYCEALRRFSNLTRDIAFTSTTNNIKKAHHIEGEGVGVAFAATACPQHDGNGDACHGLDGPCMRHDLGHKAS